jgi:hypothetical protein
MSVKIGKRRRMFTKLIDVGHDKQRTRRPRLNFEELLAKYKKKAEANVTNRLKKVQSSRLPLKRKS